MFSVYIQSIKPFGVWHWPGCIQLHVHTKVDLITIVW